MIGNLNPKAQKDFKQYMCCRMWLIRAGWRSHQDLYNNREVWTHHHLISKPLTFLEACDKQEQRSLV